MENANKKYYCPACNGELEMLSGCGAVGYFCNHCRKLVSRSKMLSTPATDFSRSILLVIDMQIGLLARDIWNKDVIINNINKLIDFSHQKGMPVIFARHSNQSFLIAESQDWQICDCLHLQPDDVFVNKTKASIFSQKSFTDYLKEKSTATMIVTGLVSNGCVQAACLDGLKNQMTVILAEDGHSTFHKGKEANVKQWNKTLEEQGVSVLPTDTIISG
jgi:nicotinamidase-related amidase